MRRHIAVRPEGADAPPLTPAHRAMLALRDAILNAVSAPVAAIVLEARAQHRHELEPQRARLRRQRGLDGVLEHRGDVRPRLGVAQYQQRLRAQLGAAHERRTQLLNALDDRQRLDIGPRHGGARLAQRREQELGAAITEVEGA